MQGLAPRDRVTLEILSPFTLIPFFPLYLPGLLSYIEQLI